MKYLIGIQPTGKLTIGNYLGCLKKGLRLQEEGHDVTFLIANYHSLTTDSYTDVTEQELIKLGCRNIKKQTPEYTELFFKLCCKLNLGTLLKMPQYKDKKENVEFDLGLMLYPVLMAADIIINDPDVVIVGKDQIAHLDLCNDISKRFNGKYYNYELGDVDKIMSLIEANASMLWCIHNSYDMTIDIDDENFCDCFKGKDVNVFTAIIFRKENRHFFDAFNEICRLGEDNPKSVLLHIAAQKIRGIKVVDNLN